jgi:hypothetical protein
MVGFSPVSYFQVRLPMGNDQTSLLNVAVIIRDILDCVVEVNMSSIIVMSDSVGINNLINDLQGSSSQIANNPIVQLLFSGNQNIVAQIITSLSQQFNQMGTESVNNAISSKY